MAAADPPYVIHRGGTDVGVTLEYQTPPPPKHTEGRAAFWGTFALAAVVGAPFGDWVLESWYHQQHPDGIGFILSCICLLPTAVVLLVLRSALPKRTGSPLLGLAFGLFGPLAGLVLLDIFLI